MEGRCNIFTLICLFGFISPAPAAETPLPMVKVKVRDAHPGKSWANGPCYEAYKDSFGVEFENNFIRASGGMRPTQKLVDEAAEANWNVIFQHYYKDLSIPEAEELLKDESDSRWLKLIELASDNDLQKKMLRINTMIGIKARNNPSVYIKK